MLYIDKATILKFDLEMLKKRSPEQSSLLPCCCLSSGCCISFPFVSGDILSTVVGALLICSGIALIVGLFSNRSHHFWPVLSICLVAVAYLFDRLFLHPRTGAGHFCHCSVFTLYIFQGYSPDELVSSAFNERQLATARYWCAGYRHCLDIPGATPMVSVTLVSTLVGIELIFSAASL